jgi:UDPglucose 6-dehydrogenase
MKEKIGIIGLGYVGSTLEKWFEKKNTPLFLYDKYKNIGSLDEVSKANIIFLCLPTPYKKNNTDLSSFVENLNYFKPYKNKIFIIKSTVPPGTTENFQKLYPQHKFLFNPEFLIAGNSWETFLNPDLQIIGYTKKTKNIAPKFLSLLPKAKNFNGIIPATAAEIVKFAINSFLAMKVIFANQVYDLCKKLNVDYDFVLKALQNEDRLGKSHFEIFHGGYRGFGGACLPKDLLSFIKVYKNLGLKPKLFESVWQINYKYLKDQKLISKLKKSWLNNKP